MKASNYAIERPRVVMVCLVVVLAVTVLAALNISVQRTPAIHKAVILVAVPHPGALPTEVEEQITRKIEEKLQKLDQVDFVSSTSMRGSSVTQVMFLDGVDPEKARGEVKDLVDEVRRELPVAREVVPIVTDIDFENTPLMLVNLVPPEGFDERALKRVAEEVQEELQNVEGVSTTQLFGGRQREIHVNLNLDLAAEHGITINQVSNALTQYHAELPGGPLETNEYEFRVRSDAKFRNLEDIRQTVVAHEQGRVIRVSDIAEVEDTYQRITNVAHLNGSEAATIIVYKENDTNTLATAQNIKKRVKELQEVYPFLDISTTRDTSAEIAIMFRVLGSSFVFGAMLVLVILSWAMGLRTSLLVLLAIPFSSAVALCFLFFLQIPVSNMVIFSFILVLGMVVDGAIIVAENIHRHIERGETPREAATIGIEEVGVPVIMADLTTVSAYLPMLLVPGIMGDFMSVMPKVVSMALLGSVLVDHFVIPTLAAMWYRQRKPEEGTTVVAGGTHTAMRVSPQLGFFSRQYSRLLGWSLNHRWAILTSTGLCLAWAYFMLNHVGFTFFPPSDRGQFEVKYELPLGNSVYQTIAAARVITEPLKEMKEYGQVVNFVSAIGSSEGLASRLENDPAVGPEFGTVMVQLRSPLDRSRHEKLVIKELRRRIEEQIHLFPGMKYSIHEVEEGPPGGSDVAVRFTGDQIEHLGGVADVVAARLRELDGTVDGSTDYRDENPEIVVDPDPAVLPFYDINKMQISQAIQAAVTGNSAIQLSLDDEDVTLRLQAAPRYRRDRGSIERLVLSSPAGRRATVGELSNVHRSLGVYAVNRRDRKRAVVAKCDVVDGETTPDKVFNVLRKETLPDLGFKPVVGNNMVFLGTPGTPSEGIRATFTGENEERDKNFSYLLISMLIAVGLIFVILVIQFNSLAQSLIVLTTVPLSFVGVVVGMWLCDFPFSLATFIGLVSLAGVVVNDAIVMVDFINQARERGLPMRESITEASINRLRPVLLTTATTIGGLLPLMLNLSGGAEFWQPLTGAVIFGLGFATVLTLVLVPVAYSLVYNREFRASAVA